MPLPILTEFQIFGWNLSDLLQLTSMYEQKYGAGARPSNFNAILKSPEELEQEVLNPVGPRYF